jgi:hypothetical protein
LKLAEEISTPVDFYHEKNSVVAMLSNARGLRRLKASEGI